MKSSEAEFMTFGGALETLKAGKRVARRGWNGKGMWIALVPQWEWMAGGPDPVSGTTFLPPLELLPWIGMKTADNGFVPWLASQTDLLAEDWAIV
jgi:hypothetical protein